MGRLGVIIPLALAAMLAAEEPPPIGILRGKFVKFAGGETRGEFSLATSDNKTYACIYDEKTYVENNRLRVSIAALTTEDIIDVLSDRAKAPGRCYARTIHVVNESQTAKGRTRPYKLVTEHIAPRGDLTFSGVVLRVGVDAMILRTRTDGEKAIKLRQDTKYVYGGSLVEPSMLVPNMRVFVRAGRNLSNDIEAYQIAWGEILNAR